MGRSYLVSDTALNDQDKALTNPIDVDAYLRSLRVEYTATATAGTRTLEVRIRDSAADVIWATEITTDFIASDIMVVNFSSGAATVVPVDNGDEGSQHLALLPLKDNWDVQVLATAGSNAGDDMVLHSVWESAI